MLLMTLKQYSTSRNIAESTLRKLAMTGEIAAGKVGRNYLLDVELVDEYFREKLSTHQKIDIRGLMARKDEAWTKSYIAAQRKRIMEEVMNGQEKTLRRVR